MKKITVNLSVKEYGLYLHLSFFIYQYFIDFYFYSIYEVVQFSSLHLLSRVQLFATPWTAVLQASLSITNAWSSPKLMSIESVMPSNHLIPCCPRLLLPSIFPSIRVLSNESVLCIRWPKYWFQLQHQSFQ